MEPTCRLIPFPGRTPGPGQREAADAPLPSILPLQNRKVAKRLHLSQSPPLRPPSWAGSHQLPEPRGVVLVVKAGQEDEGGRRALMLSRVSIT